jgi:hypothetical protein
VARIGEKDEMVPAILTYCQTDLFDLEVYFGLEGMLSDQRNGWNLANPRPSNPIM